METTTDTATISRQKVAAMLRKAGYSISSEYRNSMIGYTTRTGGWSVIDNGKTEYICKSCRTRDSHRSRCTTRNGAAKYWRQQKVKDGTVTVEWHNGDTWRGFDHAEAQERVDRMAEFLTDAGLKVTRNTDNWRSLHIAA